MTYMSQIQALPPRRGQPPPMTPTNPQEQLDQFPEDWSVIEELLAFAFSLEDVVEQATRIAPEGSRAMTLPAPTSARSPMTTPGSTVEFAPTLAPRRTMVRFNSNACLLRGYRSLVKTTFGPRCTSSSMVTPSQM